MELQDKRGGEEVIPRMQRFWGDEGQENLLPGGWGEEGVSYEDVQ